MQVGLQDKLVAILIVDVPGYDRLMQDDQAATRVGLQRQYREVIDASIAIHGGRIFELEEDHTIAEFGGPLGAVRCALDIHEGLARRNPDLPAAERVPLRLGIHYGQVRVDKGELEGEALTIADRVKALAKPGEICISRTVLDHVQQRLGLTVEDLAGLDRAAPSEGLAFRLCIDDTMSRRGMPPWLANLGRLTVTVMIAVAAVWLAMTSGG